ncbi:hypothetical protein OS123_03240 [Corynebacterium sp. P5875]|uniref:VWFA domain-containing protein n=1 Tax=Corynebacterium antarcticum TaxID=2800405 RepID=A0A9Q4GLA3_9CORY|nr:hypothetical protein [Corynebacterium antarcticum]MCX7537563.1 hypothetical protein [Corynebacterium antarcticum]
MRKQEINEFNLHEERKIAYPLYFIVDTSPSMQNFLPDVEKTISTFKTFIKQHHFLAEIIPISIITFDHSARTLIPLGNLANVEEEVKFNLGTSTRFLRHCSYCEK